MNIFKRTIRLVKKLFSENQREIDLVTFSLENVNSKQVYELIKLLEGKLHIELAYVFHCGRCTIYTTNDQYTHEVRHYFEYTSSKNIEEIARRMDNGIK